VSWEDKSSKIYCVMNVLFNGLSLMQRLILLNNTHVWNDHSVENHLKDIGEIMVLQVSQDVLGTWNKENCYQLFSTQLYFGQSKLFSCLPCHPWDLKIIQGKRSWHTLLMDTAVISYIFEGKYLVQLMYNMLFNMYSIIRTT
jgi:hypothetical protein